MRNYIRSTYLNPGETHLENQLLPTIGGNNSTVCSAPPPSWITNHAPEQQVTSSRHSILKVHNKIQQESFHTALSLRVHNKLSDGLMKWEKHSTHAFTAKFLHAQHGVPCYSSALVYIAFAQVLCHPNQISNQIPKSL